MRISWTTPLLVLLIVGLLLAGTAARARLLAVRQAAGLVPAEISRLPPVGAASVVLLGGFRGVAVDILWLQAMTYHQRRQYVEERGIIELVTEIQPHFVSVWAFWALAIAYDISVQEADPRDQWPWIKDAVDFLGKGIEINPESGDLWFYLGQIYREKMSQNPYFEEACERDLGVNNHEAAARAYDRSRRLSWGPAFPFAPRVADGSVFLSHLARAGQVLRRATLDDDLSFSPATLAHLSAVLDRCRAESDDLNARYPGDVVYTTLPARIDLALADGMLAQVARILTEGECSDASIARARKVLDKALAEVDNLRSKQDDPHVQWWFDSKTVNAWTRIPLALVRHVRERMVRPTVGADDLGRCRQLLQVAQRELDRVPETVQSAPDIVSLREFVKRTISHLKAP